MGGKQYFYQIWKYYSDYFQKAMIAENKSGGTVFEGEPLEDLASKWEKSKGQIEFDTEDARPCMCAF
jgi:hypothetical protein